MPDSGSQPAPRHWILLGAVLLLIGIVLLPPLINIGRYQHRIAESISRSIGRQVRLSSVTLHLVPRPALEFSSFIVEERPEFGSEPVLRCDNVVADLRLLSLWRGRLEVSSIHFDGASLNLVRNAQGSWNFASILLQAASIPNAPTAQRYAGRAPRFPYIEAVNSRINFKQGEEKKPLSFLNADLSVWLESPDEWQVRFRAQPARTDLDLDLADTGVLRIDGALHRASTLGEMPLKLEASWSRAPLGQLARLTLGSDTGWRGDVDVEAAVTGTADAAQLRSRLHVAGLHRAEFTSVPPLDVEASCRATYRWATASLDGILCASPVGGGELRLTGSLMDVQTQPQPALALDLKRIPAASFVAAIQQLRGTPSLQFTGAVSGHFDYAAAGNAPPRISGEMEANPLTLTFDSGRSLALAPVRVLCESVNPAATAEASRMRASSAPAALVLQPVKLSMGAAGPVTVDGRFTSTGFDLHLNGPSTLERLAELNRDFRILNGPFSSASRGTAASFSSVGTATMNLEVSGPWLPPLSDADLPVPSSTVEGSIAIRGAEITAPFLAQPLRVEAAQGILSPARIEWTSASVNYGSLHAQGTLEYPTQCLAASTCVRRFQLQSANLDLGELQASLLGSERNGEFLHAILDRFEGARAPWPSLSGTFQIAALSVGRLTVRDVSGTAEIAENSIKVSSLDGHVLKGTLHMNGRADMAGDQPTYQLDLQVANASPSALAGVFGERWGSGEINFSAQIEMSGFSLAQLAQTASGSLRWDWNKGSLLSDSGSNSPASPLGRFDQWSAEATVGEQSIKIGHSLLARGAKAIPVSGTIFFDRHLDLRGSSATQSVAVTGTLDHPAENTFPQGSGREPAPAPGPKP